MKTGKALNDILGDIWSKAGLGEEYEEQFATLRDNIAERDNILHGYGEAWDENAEDFTFTATPPAPAPTGGDWEQKYNDLQKRYISRFFTGGDGEIQNPEPQPEPEKQPGEGVTYSDLFTKEEK